MRREEFLKVILKEVGSTVLKKKNKSSTYTYDKGFFAESDLIAHETFKKEINKHFPEDFVLTEEDDINLKNNNFKKGIEGKSISCKSPIDKVYLNSSNDCYLEDKKLNRIISIKKSNSDSLVVWNPGSEKANTMGDMGKKNEWRRMVCIETANTLENSVVIYPKLSHSISAEYSVQEY